MDLKSLVSKRAGVKAQLTAFSKHLDSIDKSNNSYIFELTKRLQKIEINYEKFSDIQGEIDVLEADEEKSLAERELFDNNHFSLIAKAEVLLREGDARDDSKSLLQGGLGSVNFPEVKLPRIDLPSFSGKFTDWQEYFDSFNALVNSNSKLSSVEKLIYLKGSLSGEAASIVKSLKTTESNYAIAWKSLCDRYNKKRRIVDTHVREILNFKPVSTLSKDAHVKLREFINEIENNLRCLEALGQTVDAWDTILVPIILNKLDDRINHDWEARNNNQSPDYLPTYKELISFLNIRQSTLESTASLRATNETKVDEKYKKNTRTLTTVNYEQCALCKQHHTIQRCEKYLQLSVSKRNEQIKSLKLCLNCLKPGHFMGQCSSSNCRTCGKKHHTTLHLNFKEEKRATNAATLQNNEQGGESENSQRITTCNSNTIKGKNEQVLLPTAEIYAYNVTGQRKMLRALLDSASQSSFLTKKACEMLNLNVKNADLMVTGISQGMSRINKRTIVKIGSRHNNFETSVQCFILEQITSNLPSIGFKVSALNIPPNIKLADSKVNVPGSIDMLLGADVFWELLSIGQIRTTQGAIFHKTKLGWIISGPINTKAQPILSSTFLSMNQIHDDLKTFWKVDEFTSHKEFLTPEERYCEDHFKTTTTRGNDGRFIVKIPMKEDVTPGDNGYDNATKRFKSLENRLDKNENMKKLYVDCIKDYMDQGHMTESKLEENVYYIPHHGVLKDSDTTRLRVVFDASYKPNSSETSINDMQCVGATIQDDLFSIVSRFRTHQFVLTADIMQMYRQIWVAKEDRKFQTILWREDANSPINSYVLNTVTFGMASAPFLAVRCLVEIAHLNQDKFPKECHTIKNDFYVDDLVTGGDSMEKLETMKSNLTNLLSKYGFRLRKWKNNYSYEDVNGSVEITKGTSKVLGINWEPQTDEFIFHITNLKTFKKVNKRSILAITSQLFDPLGLMSPVVLNAKLIIQELWQLKLTWDESIPASLHTQWVQFKTELEQIKNYRLPRCILVSNATLIEFHCFSDASERAYGACIYVKSRNTAGECKVQLLASKSRVSPLRKITLPRLELLAAVLMAQLFKKFTDIFESSLTINEYFWTDSQIVLSWINSQPNRWSTFVANRVALIQETTNVLQWFHIRSECNPADLVSRGCQPSQREVLKQFWFGPPFLYEDNLAFESSSAAIDMQDLPEGKSKKTVALPTTLDFSFIERFSQYTRLLRVVAWCLRFKENCVNKNERIVSENLTLFEINKALTKIVKVIQVQAFSLDYNCLSQGKALHTKSNLLSLNPFLDEDGLLRVGGRLRNSEFNYEKKHPILLPKNNHFTELVFKHKHKELLHAGPSLLLSCIREKFWPMSGKTMAKRICRGCVVCHRYNAKPLKPIMGNLPNERVRVSTPFSSVGVDYAGPIYIKDRSGRGSKLQKAYISLFVCLATKALHLELVTSLTTDAFLACLRRFVARRGKPTKIFSDNGTNFQGAKRELAEFQKYLNENSQTIIDNCINDGVEWNFIPAYSPHFGGLWEAGVKSVKSHLKRVIGNANLTYEDLYTLLVQIESVLNSRPLMPLSSDPNDLTPLTPSHFLMGRPLGALPEADITDINTNRLDRYQHIQQLSQHFWNRWSREYVHHLQQRIKWQTPDDNISEGVLVLIKDEREPPYKWPMGRVVKLCTGADGVVRVVWVKSANGTFKRSVAKLCPLPINV